MAGVLGDMELAAEAAAGLAINIAEDKAAAQQMAADLKVYNDQLLDTSTRTNLLLNHTPGLAFHLWESKIMASTVQLPFGRCFASCALRAASSADMPRWSAQLHQHELVPADGAATAEGPDQPGPLAGICERTQRGGHSER